MPKRVKITRISGSARHVRRQSRTVKHLKTKVTMCILVVLLIVAGAYKLVAHQRTHSSAGDVEVVVGNSLMARIDSADAGEGVPVLDALDEVAVRPTSLQVLIFTGPELDISVTAQEASGYSFRAQDRQMQLYDEQGRLLGAVQRVYLPTDSDAVQRAG